MICRECRGDRQIYVKKPAKARYAGGPTRRPIACPTCNGLGIEGVSFESEPMHIEFRVYGIPKGQPRPRAFARKMGGKTVARVYEAGTAEAWKGDVIRCGAKFKPDSPIAEPVRVDVEFLLKRPKRLMRKRDPDGRIFAPGKPDRDNLDKAVLDSLTADGWFSDDAIVVDGRVRKMYHGKNEAPGAVITITNAGA